MSTELVRLAQVDLEELLELLNDPSLRRHMPLATGDFDLPGIRGWVAAKEALWAAHGYGPWALLLDGELAGWGGFQPEDGEVDLALVLRPRYWGAGKVFFDEMVSRGFGDLNFESVTILLPPSRTNVRALSRLGFVRDGSATSGNATFLRYRLSRDRG